MDTSNYIYLAMTSHYYGYNKNRATAIRYMREIAGKERVTTYGYKLYKVHPDFEVDGVWGDIITPIGHPPILVADRTKKPMLPLVSKSK
jgi:hypothetical protein